MDALAIGILLIFSLWNTYILEI